MIKKRSSHVVLVNIFGAVGYLFLVMVWMFLVALAVAFGFLQAGTPATSVEVDTVTQTPPSSQPSVVLIVSGYVLTALFGIGILAALLLLPYFLAKWGGVWLRRGMKVFKIRVTHRYVFLTKSILAAVPLVGMIVINLMIDGQNVTFALVQGVSTALAALAIGLFLIQMLLARRFKVSIEQSW